MEEMQKDCWPLLFVLNLRHLGFLPIGNNLCHARQDNPCQMPDMGDIRQYCLISAAPASRDKPHLSNHKYFLGNDVTAERRYTAIETCLIFVSF